MFGSLASPATVRGAANDAQVQLVRNGDLAVTAAELMNSYLNEALSEKGFPKELAQILGTSEIMLARAIESQGVVTATALDLVRAEFMMAIYKSELRSQGRSDQEIAEAAVAGGIGLNLSPIWPGAVAQAQAPAQTSDGHKITLRIATNSLPGGAFPTLKQYMGVVINSDGNAETAGVDDSCAGIASSIDGNYVTIALPGTELDVSSSNALPDLVPGILYYTNPPSLGALVNIPLVRLADVPAQFQVVSACAQALTVNSVLVLSRPAGPRNAVMNGLIT